MTSIQKCVVDQIYMYNISPTHTAINTWFNKVIDHQLFLSTASVSDNAKRCTNKNIIFNICLNM